MKRVIKDPTYSIFSKGGNVVNKNKEIDKKQLADLEKLQFDLERDIIDTLKEDFEKQINNSLYEVLRRVNWHKNIFVKKCDSITIESLISVLDGFEKAEIELKLAKEFTDKLIMSMQEGLLIINLEGKIIMVNDSTCDMLGYTNEELIRLNFPYPFAKKEDFEEMSNTKDRVARGEAPFFKFEFIRKSGEKFWASFLAGNIKNDKGEVIAMFGTIKDISEEEKAKNLLIENAAKSNQKKNVILELSALVGSDYKSALRKITMLSAKTLNVARVGVWVFNQDKNEIECEKLFDVKGQNFESGAILSK